MATTTPNTGRVLEFIKEYTQPIEEAIRPVIARAVTAGMEYIDKTWEEKLWKQK